MLPKWLGRFDILKEDDKNDLERHSASYEYELKFPREQAELMAYNRYKENQHIRGAAHHLDGLKKAKEDGRFEDERRHLTMYNMHTAKLGHDPYAPIDPRLQAYRNPDYTDKGFTPHPADPWSLAK